MVNIPIKIDEMFEYYIIDRKLDCTIGCTIEPSQTVTTWGKKQVAGLVGGITGYYPIDEMRVIKDGSLTTIDIETPTRNNNTLVITSTTISTPGSYSIVMCGSSNSPSEYHNSINATIVLGSDQDLILEVKFAFSGLNEDGNVICASRLGAIGDDYDTYIAYIGATVDGSSTIMVLTANTIINETTLRVMQTGTGIEVPGTYTNFSAITEGYISSPGDIKFHEFTGSTVVVGENQAISVIMDFEFQ